MTGEIFQQAKPSQKQTRQIDELSLIILLYQITKGFFQFIHTYSHKLC